MGKKKHKGKKGKKQEATTTTHTFSTDNLLPRYTWGLSSYLTTPYIDFSTPFLNMFSPRRPPTTPVAEGDEERAVAAAEDIIHQHQQREG